MHRAWDAKVKVTEPYIELIIAMAWGKEGLQAVEDFRGDVNGKQRIFGDL